MYCKGHPKAIVTYNFNGSDRRDFITENTPIEVRKIEKWIPNFLGGQCPIIYNVTYRRKLGANDSELVGTVGLRGPIHGADMVGVFPEDPGYDGYSADRTGGSFSANLRIYYQDTYISVGGSSGGFFNQPGFVPLRKDYYIYLVSIVPAQNQPDNCGDPKKICELQIIKDGKTIFVDQGECPCEFSVQCGDCPPGTTRCVCTGYPGYCCLPCKPIADEIKAITNQIRSLKNG